MNETFKQSRLSGEVLCGRFWIRKNDPKSRAKTNPQIERTGVTCPGLVPAVISTLNTIFCLNRLKVDVKEIGLIPEKPRSAPAGLKS